MFVKVLNTCEGFLEDGQYFRLLVFVKVLNTCEGFLQDGQYFRLLVFVKVVKVSWKMANILDS